MSAFVHEHFIPFQANIVLPDERMAFRRFGAIFAPTAIVLNSEGVERYRIEGFLPPREFLAQLMMAQARIVAMRKRWANAEPLYARIVDEFGDTSAAPEALYWRGVSAYQGRRDHTALVTMATEMKRKYPGSVWAIKSSVWA